MKFLVLAIITMYSLTAEFKAQTTQFTYQGRFTDATAVQPTNGTYEMQFKAFDASANGNQFGATMTIPTVQVVNGIFTVTEELRVPYLSQLFWENFKLFVSFSHRIRHDGEALSIGFFLSKRFCRFSNHFEIVLKKSRQLISINLSTCVSSDSAAPIFYDAGRG